MNSDTVKALVNEQDRASHRLQPVTVPHGDLQIPLCGAVGKDACPPPNAPDQPDVYPRNSQYMFDREKYCGKNSFNDLKKMLVRACSGCTLYLQEEARESHHYLTWCFRCNHYPVQGETSKPKFKEGHFTKEGVKEESYKQHSSKNKGAFSRMKSPKTRSCPKHLNLKAEDLRMYEGRCDWCR